MKEQHGQGGMYASLIQYLVYGKFSEQCVRASLESSCREKKEINWQVNQKMDDAEDQDLGLLQDNGKQ